MESEYDIPPRGRVSFDCVKEQFLLLADPCVLADPTIVSTLRDVFELQEEKTTMALDLHYRCSRCLRKSAQ
jgi:hypothetical protein